MRVFPNPSAGDFTIEIVNTENNPIAFEIYNSQGEKVYLSSPKEKIFQINLKDFPKGVYLTRGIFSDIILTKKIIIQ